MGAKPQAPQLVSGQALQEPPKDKRSVGGYTLTVALKQRGCQTLPFLKEKNLPICRRSWAICRHLSDLTVPSVQIRPLLQ